MALSPLQSQTRLKNWKMPSVDIPSLRPTATSKQLLVHGKPFLILGGELQNSSFSSAEYMKGVWSKLTSLNLNTVLGSVSWEQIEPAEGRFDFTSLDQVLSDARSHDLHVILLWFGSFKNGILDSRISIKVSRID
jgi:GH35 family endo-1,4-beta-xylanase